jgi:rhodanese-related sulfurtransferase
VNGDSIQNPTLARTAKKILLEAALVAAVGVALAFAANEISPDGLKLTRNYFPAGIAAPTPAARAANANSAAPPPFVVAELKQQGLQLIDLKQALQFFHDPRFQKNLVVFIDARDEKHYLEGHIPGAYEFDPYHPERKFDAILPLCQKAEQIIVYCNGGDCDDSVSAAVFLKNVGIPAGKIFVCGGGITEWEAKHLPVETGARK